MITSCVMEILPTKLVKEFTFVGTTILNLFMKVKPRGHFYDISSVHNLDEV